MLILGIDCSHTFLSYFHTCWYRLASSPDASARASHDLNKMISGLAAFCQLHDLVCIYQAMANCYLKLCAFKEFPVRNAPFNFNSSFFNTIHSSDRSDVKFFERHFTPGDYFVSCPKCCFHNAACCSEYYCSPG